MADDFVINAQEMRALLDDANSPVVADLRKSAKRVGRGAARRTHGRIAAGIKTHEPARDAQGWHADIETAAEDPETGAPIGLFIEVGTVPHVIEAKGPYSLHNAGTGQYFGPKVNHPGTDPQPHLRPALYEDL